jgi:hypothetical protein
MSKPTTLAYWGIALPLFGLLIVISALLVLQVKPDLLGAKPVAKPIAAEPIKAQLPNWATRVSDMEAELLRSKKAAAQAATQSASRLRSLEESNLATKQELLGIKLLVVDMQQALADAGANSGHLRNLQFTVGQLVQTQQEHSGFLSAILGAIPSNEAPMPATSPTRIEPATPPASPVPIPDTF